MGKENYIKLCVEGENWKDFPFSEGKWKIQESDTQTWHSKAASICSFVSWNVIHFSLALSASNDRECGSSVKRVWVDFVNGTVIFHRQISFFYWMLRKIANNDSSACKTVDKIALLDSLFHLDVFQSYLKSFILIPFLALSFREYWSLLRSTGKRRFS